MLVIIWTLLGLILALILALCLRWRISLEGKFLYDKELFEYSVHGVVGGELRGVGILKDGERLAFFLGRADAPLLSFTLKGKEKPDKKPSRKKPKKVKKRSLNVLGMISAVRRSLRWHGLDLSGEFGLKDPSQTGKVFGGLTALGNGFLPHRFQLDVQPNFDRQMANVHCVTAIQFRPGALAWRVGRAYFTTNR